MKIFIMDDNTHLLAEEVEQHGHHDPMLVPLGLSWVIRYWGTTQGRGQLALEGPTEKTICDPEPAGGVVNLLHVRRIIPVTSKAILAWKLFLGEKGWLARRS